MRVAGIKLTLLLLTLVPNYNYGLKKTRKYICHLKTIQLSWTKINNIVLKEEKISTWIWNNYNDNITFYNLIMEMKYVLFETKLRICCSWFLKIPVVKMNCLKISVVKNIFFLFIVTLISSFLILRGNLHDKISRIKIRRLHAVENIYLIPSYFF
jgi:hypothetical protein